MSSLKNKEILSKLVFLVGLLLLWSLVRGFWSMRKAYRRIDEAEKMLWLEEVKHEELEEKLNKVQGEDYVEEVIRNELNMQKEGELVVVVEKDGVLGSPRDVRVDEEETKDDGKGNLEKWLDVVR
jgi:cell division protein FtsB